jgi:mono/diheme cytochrome c family protein
MQKNLLIVSLILLAASIPSLSSHAQAPAAKSAAKGKALYKQLRCASCHSIEGKGGCLAPALDGVTSKRTKNYLVLRLSNAKGDEDRFIELIGHQELVPHPRFPRTQIESIVDYLSTLKKPAKAVKKGKAK